MQASVAVRRFGLGLGLTAMFAVVPNVVSAQSGKWVATISQLTNGGGAADITVDKRNDKQSRVKISFRNTRRDMRLAWDILAAGGW